MAVMWVGNGGVRRFEVHGFSKARQGEQGTRGREKKELSWESLEMTKATAIDGGKNIYYY